MPAVPKPPKREKKAPKPIARRTRPKPMSARRRAEMPIRKNLRQQVIQRDRGRCRACGTLVGEYGHAHEIVFRSRGGSPLELANVVLVCAKCHQDIHAHVLKIICADDPELGANGSLLWERAPRQDPKP